MKRIILNIIVIALKIIYMPFKLLKIQDKIVYISRQSNKETLDFKLIKRSMESMYPNTQNVILTKKIEHGLINKINPFIYDQANRIAKEIYKVLYAHDSTNVSYSNFESSNIR